MDLTWLETDKWLKDGVLSMAESQSWFLVSNEAVDCIGNDRSSSLSHSSENAVDETALILPPMLPPSLLLVTPPEA